jgi:hypothetical protein
LESRGVWTLVSARGTLVGLSAAGSSQRNSEPWPSPSEVADSTPEWSEMMPIVKQQEKEM